MNSDKTATHGEPASDKTAEEVARRAMEIAGDICVYTNSNIVIETLELD